MILRGDVNVVHVEQNAAVGALDHFVQKFPLRHFRDVKLRVAAHVLDGDGNFQKIAHLANFLRRDSRGLKGVGHGQQIVRVAPVDAAPAKMIGKPGRFGALDQALSSGADARDSAFPRSRNTSRRRAARRGTARGSGRGSAAGARHRS